MDVEATFTLSELKYMVCSLFLNYCRSDLLGESDYFDTRGQVGATEITVPAASLGYMATWLLKRVPLTCIPNIPGFRMAKLGKKKKKYKLSKNSEKW